MNSTTVAPSAPVKAARSRRRFLAAAGITTLALSLTACGSTADTTGHPAAAPTPPAATAPVTHPAANVAALTQQQLQSAAVTTSDVAGQQMGVLPMTDSPIEQSDTRVQPSTCEALASAWEGGGPNFPSTGAVDLKIMEGNSGQSGTAHLMHLASYDSATATRLLDSIATAAGSCSSYTLPDPSGPIHETITPVASPQFGDQAVAWHAVLTGTSGQRYVSTVTVVRVGGTVINAVELANNLSSADQLPTTSSFLLAAQINKLRAVS
jgi:hypothetical protein